MLSSPLRGIALELDPVNTYEASVWPTNELTVDNNTDLWVMTIKTDGFKNPVETSVITVDSATDSVRIVNDYGDKVEAMNTSGGLTKLLEVTPSLNIRIRGSAGFSSGTFTITDSSFPPVDWASWSDNLPKRLWVSSELEDIRVNGTIAESLAAYFVDFSMEVFQAK
jgi:hypothetical protein